MNKLIDYIISKGFEGRKTGEISSFSTMGNLRSLFENKEGVKIVFGFNEHKKPPTLVYPRPRILRTIDGVIYDQHSDDVMNHCLMKEKTEDIFNAMFDDSILFKY